MLDQNWIRNFFRSIGYPIGPPSKIYENNQVTIKRVLVYIITPQSIPIDVLINALHELHIGKLFDMVDTRSNMQLADLNSEPLDGKILRNIVDSAILSRFYPTPGLEHYKLLRLYQFSGTSHINFEQEK